VRRADPQIKRRKPEEARKKADLHVRLTQAQMDLIDQWAAAENLDRSQWARQQLLKLVAWDVERNAGLPPPSKLGLKPGAAPAADAPAPRGKKGRQ